jgi:hypothetical protein
MMIFLACLLTWWAIGFSSFAYWYTKDYDLDTARLVFGLLIGIVLGPLAFLAGWLIHGDSIEFSDKVWIAKRKS